MQAAGSEASTPGGESPCKGRRLDSEEGESACQDGRGELAQINDTTRGDRARIEETEQQSTSYLAGIIISNIVIIIIVIIVIIDTTIGIVVNIQ